ncbi:flavin reductase family protein [Paenibacillus wynnii]|uniref:flavin reductase family protein n=1 Tax=Paenibacillus wynnii TaxID=268407 RepID=UPI0027901CEB|nr:flavin reductase family protein [Paenibacillus wynnii]MDQ0192366.1 flavin reductase (DIM6/NTAB) family NADH-FMN oxidoreductase RutF [Paenibacillus wynnii]
MFIRAETQTVHENYKLLIGSIVPRPIAFVTSIDEEGIVNAAPFSFFNIVNNDPPMIMFSCNRLPNGEMKGTSRNILGNKEFVVHIADEDNIEAINYTSINAPHGISEISLAGLTTVPAQEIRVPRVQECKIAMECRLVQHVDLGKSDMIIGEVLVFYIEDELYENGRINIDKLKPVSRLAGATYGTIGRTFDMARPQYDNK